MLKTIVNRSHSFANKLILCVVCSILLFLIPPIKIDARFGSDTAPYLYYYSDIQKALIIERANGKESRTLFHWTPKEGQSIAGDGWSSSGRWFAWYETIPGMAGEGSGNTRVVNQDGLEQFILRDNCSVAKMHWSPIEDTLLIGCYDRNAGVNNFAYYIYDVNTHKSLLYVNREILGLTGDIYSITDMEWTPDGQYAVVYYPASVAEDETTYTMTVYDKNGNMVYKRNFYSVDFHKFRPYWSKNGSVAYVGLDKNLHIENLAQDMKIILHLPTQDVGFVDWSPNGEYALVYIGSFQRYIDEVSSHPIYFLSIPEKKIKLLTENGRQLEIKEDGLIDFYSNNTTWSLLSSDTKGFFADRTNNVFVIEAPQMDVKNIPIQLNIGFNLYPSFIRWTHQGDTLALLGYDLRSYRGMLYSYDTTSQIVTSDNTLSNIVVNNFYYSPNDEYLAFSSNECSGACVINFIQHIKHNLSFKSSNDRPGPSAEILWHPNANWLIIAGDPVGISRHLNVANADGSIDRNLNVRCDIVPSCFGWLPPQSN